MEQTKNNRLPLVSISCITYNHEKYIRDTIEGFLIQKTNFPFEIIIHDDASTDNTANIIREYEKKYPELFVCIYQTENQYSKGVKISATFNWPRARGKYIALCEGDDYWTDPYKLQKQVDFLEANPDYGMVHTNYNILYQDTGKITKRDNPNLPSGDIYEQFILNTIVRTATVMFHRKYIDEVSNFYKKTQRNWQMGDRVLFQIITSQSRVHYIEDITAIYRRHSKSITSFKSVDDELEFIQSSYELRFLFIKDVRSVSKKTFNELNRLKNKSLLLMEYRLNRKDNIDEIFNNLKKYGLTIPDYLRYYSFKNPLVKLVAKLVFKMFE